MNSEVKYSEINFSQALFLISNWKPKNSSRKISISSWKNNRRSSSNRYSGSRSRSNVGDDCVNCVDSDRSDVVVDVVVLEDIGSVNVVNGDECVVDDGSDENFEKCCVGEYSAYDNSTCL